ncbi:DUF7662 domain-containing protein [Novosphingobium lentum]|uniref:DUF7662 domain-containing protein n=1 Tax=Novosphingobium lentum TaxID=145287 RepID=UPI000834EFC4|nr:hypothetical protein [Novosphingobium lentum]
MGKYDPLTHYLETRPEEIWDARFAEVERVLGFPLPRSAHEYPAWWANQEPGHSQTQGWRGAGWETSQVDLASKKVRFTRRSNRSKPRPAPEAGLVGSKASDLEPLFQKAIATTGIADRAVLMRMALEALIQAETARYLDGIGGTDPMAKAPPRRRFTWRS